MTITNQTNPVGSRYESKKSPVIVPQKDGGLFGKSEKIYTTLRLTKTGNNPSVYRKEIYQHEGAKDGGNITQIGTVDENGTVVLNSQVDYGNAEEEVFLGAVTLQIKNQTKDAEKQIKDKINSDTKALNKNQEPLNSKKETDSTDSPKTKQASNKGIARKNYGTLFYPSFIQKSNQDKLKITILEFSSRFKGGKNDPKKLSKLGNVSGKPKRSDYGTNRNERGSYLRALRKYKKGKTNLTEVNGSALSLDNRKRLEVDKRLVGHITLPIPDGVTDQNKVDFGSGTLNALQVGGAELALDFLLRGAKQAGETAGDVFKQAVTDKNVQQAIAALLAGSGIGVETNDLLARTQGNINNNNLELLFKGPTLRPFNFSFNFSPRDLDESRQVQRIIRAFKQSSSVQRTPGGLFLAAPNTYKLEFISGKTNKTHAFLPRIKECALLGVNMNYMPENSYMTYDDTSMVAYNMQLAFQELEPIFNDDYDNNDTEDSGLVSTAASPFTGSIGF